MCNSRSVKRYPQKMVAADVICPIFPLNFQWVLQEYK
jgi:hypothetical protein